MSQSRPGPRILVAGIGSPHGQDQTGWIAVDWLQEAFDEMASFEIDFVKLKTPVDLLEYTSDSLVDDQNRQPSIWVLVDACIADGSGDQTSEVYCWQWPDLPCESFAKTSTHALGLDDTLRLAQTLEILPESVWVYGVRVDQDRQSIEGCFRQIASKLRIFLQ